MAETKKPALKRMATVARPAPAAPQATPQPAAPPTAPPKPAEPMPEAKSEAAVLERLLHAAAAATLAYGDTGAGKTTLLATFIQWVWRKFHVITRLYTFDPGGYSDDVLALVQLGICEVWRVYTRDPEGLLGLPSETLQRACQGWWPAEIDPATGESRLGSRLVPPPPDVRFAVCYDGLSGMCDWSMVDMGQRSAEGTLGGEGANLKPIASGDMKFGVGNRASVGFTQNKVRDWVLSSLSIPNLVTAPVFTALELKVLDSETKLPLYGPKIAGQARTTDVPAWFGATLGVCQARDEKGQPQWRLHLRDYYWPQGDLTPHKAKIRASAKLPSTELARLPDFLADRAGDRPLTYFNLGYLFDILEDIRLKTLHAAVAEFPDAPGLKPSTIGKAAPSDRKLPAAPKGLVRTGIGTPVQTGPQAALVTEKKEGAPVPATPPAEAPAAPTTPAESAGAGAAPSPPRAAVAPAPPPPSPAPPGPRLVPSATTTPAKKEEQAGATTGAPAPSPTQQVVQAVRAIVGLRPTPPGIRPIQRAPVPAAPAKKS